MANAKNPFIQLFILTLLCAALVVKGSSRQVALHSYILSAKTELNLKENARRILIGSVAPTCTYNECRGCKYKCRAEQVPVEGNDPINSAYHYKCVCHR